MYIVANFVFDTGYGVCQKKNYLTLFLVMFAKLCRFFFSFFGRDRYTLFWEHFLLLAPRVITMSFGVMIC